MSNPWDIYRPADPERDVYDPDPGPMTLPNTPYNEPYWPDTTPIGRHRHDERPMPAPKFPPAPDAQEILERLWANLLALEYQMQGVIRRLPAGPELQEVATPSAQEILELHRLAQDLAPAAEPQTPPVLSEPPQSLAMRNLEDLVEDEYRNLP